MELWEFNAIVFRFNELERCKADETTAKAWQTAAFTGRAFRGKLRSLKTYLKENTKQSAPKVDKSEFEKRLAQAKEAALNVGN